MQSCIIRFLFVCLSVVANWGIPIAALADIQKEPSIISPTMTCGLYINIDYILSTVLMRIFFSNFSIDHLFGYIYAFCHSCTTTQYVIVCLSYNKFYCTNSSRCSLYKLSVIIDYFFIDKIIL